MSIFSVQNSFQEEIDFSYASFLDMYNSNDFEIPKYIDLDKDNNKNNDSINNNITKETTEFSGTNFFKNKKSGLTNKKVGRKRLKDNQEDQKDGKVHSKDSKDNINRKVQVHFHKFILFFINEIITNFGFEKQFIDIDYRYKKNITKKNIEKLKTKEIGQILLQDISPKFRKKCKINKEINNKLYLEVIKIESIRKILSETYINIFRTYYYENKREIKDYGLNIKLSNNAKTYKDLLEKSDDNDYIEKINKEVKENYLPKKMFNHN